MSSNKINLNKDQKEACIYLENYLRNEDHYNFLLMGYAGTGKTTVIVNLFNQEEFRNKSIVFCAFTNKATQILRNTSRKFDLQFTPQFSTIHKLLGLEPRFKINNDANRESYSINHNSLDLSFEFSLKKIEDMKNYDIIVFDECSTITKELYIYILRSTTWVTQTTGKRIKLIYLGDFWQLPPIGEDISFIFKSAMGHGNGDIIRLYYNEILNKDNESKKSNNYSTTSTGNSTRKNYNKQRDIADPIESVSNTLFITEGYIWPSYKLTEIMRYKRDINDGSNGLPSGGNDGENNLESIYMNMINIISMFESGRLDLRNFLSGYPYNIIPKRLIHMYIEKYDDFIQKYIDCNQYQPDNIIITYTNKNLQKINRSVHASLHGYITSLYNNEQDQDDDIVFLEGDKCTISDTIELMNVVNKQAKSNTAASINSIVEQFMDIKIENNVDDNGNNLRLVTLDGASPIHNLYSGDVFKILSVENVNVVTPLNNFRRYGTPDNFPAQILRIVNITSPNIIESINVGECGSDQDGNLLIEIIHINSSLVKKARSMIYRRVSSDHYINVVGDFHKHYPTCDYGYSLTIYKSQGSEYDTVYINLLSLYSSAIRSGKVVEEKDIINLFKSTYTAISRAAKNVKVYWFKSK